MTGDGVNLSTGIGASGGVSAQQVSLEEWKQKQQNLLGKQLQDCLSKPGADAGKCNEDYRASMGLVLTTTVPPTEPKPANAPKELATPGAAPGVHEVPVGQFVAATQGGNTGDAGTGGHSNNGGNPPAGATPPKEIKAPGQAQDVQEAGIQGFAAKLKATTGSVGDPFAKTNGTKKPTETENPWGKNESPTIAAAKKGTLAAHPVGTLAARAKKEDEDPWKK